VSTLIDGPAGALETLLDGDGPDLAVLCHPHPQYGGTMHAAVLDGAARALAAADIACLRFNFRGVGRSAGRFDDGAGEVDDVLAVLAHGRAIRSAGRTLLVGYSFGAAMALRASGRTDGLAGVVLIAPPVDHMALGDAAPSCPVHVIAGSADAFASVPALEAFASKVEGVSPPAILDGADHFFIGAQPALEGAVAQAIDAFLS